MSSLLVLTQKNEKKDFESERMLLSFRDCQGRRTPSSRVLRRQSRGTHMKHSHLRIMCNFMGKFWAPSPFSMLPSVASSE